MNVHREVERKLRVADDFQLEQALAGLGPLNAVREPDRDLDADYFDTDELTLIRWKITLRRRTGGPDEGWHLKLPVNGRSGDREELHLPLSDHVPAELADIVSPLIGERPLRMQAKVLTTRTPFAIFNAAGTQLAEVVDDHVRIAGPSTRDLAYRQIEVEASDASDLYSLDAMELVTGNLLAAGAAMTTLGKAASALGNRASAPADVPEPQLPTGMVLAIDVLRFILLGQVRALLMADMNVRRLEDDGVHQMRVACRRLRSTLRVFAPLFEADWQQHLRAELGWLASEMGQVRDAEVVHARLTENAAVLGDQAQALQPTLDSELARRTTGGLAGALAALRSDRHQYLIEDLIDAANHPTAVTTAYLPYQQVMAPLVAQAWESLRSACNALELETPSTDWHQARIIAKRARYALEAVLPVCDANARKFAKQLAMVTELLGTHQDAYVAQESVREMAAAAEPSIAFLLGRLYEHESDLEIYDRFAFLELWPKVKKSSKNVAWV